MEHEFSEADNRVLAATSAAMRLASTGLFVWVAVELAAAAVYGSRGMWARAGLAAVKLLAFACLGVWTRRAAGSFAQVVATEGHDVSHVMGAVASLRWAYVLHGALLLALLSSAVVAFAAAGPVSAMDWMQALFGGR